VIARAVLKFPVGGHQHQKAATLSPAADTNVLDTLGKLHAHGEGSMALCRACQSGLPRSDGGVHRIARRHRPWRMATLFAFARLSFAASSFGDEGGHTFFNKMRSPKKSLTELVARALPVS
jgi:hypothetical protein